MGTEDPAWTGAAVETSVVRSAMHRPGGAGEAGSGGRLAAAVAVRGGSRAWRPWAWLTGMGYRPERHYMRGGGSRGGAVPTRPRLT